MNRVQLMKHQGVWVAHITLPNGKAAHVALEEKLSDEEAEALIQAEPEVRNQTILSLAAKPIVLDDAYEDDLQPEDVDYTLRRQQSDQEPPSRN